MSWWIGLSREEFWAEAKLRPFTYVRIMTVDDDPGYRNPWARAQMANAHRKETGFTLLTYGGVTLARDRLGFDHDGPEPDYETLTRHEPSVRRVEATRAYLEWWSSTRSDQYAATTAAADLVAMLRHGYEPDEWTPFKHEEFSRWCEEHKAEIAEMLEMVE